MFHLIRMVRGNEMIKINATLLICGDNFSPSMMEKNSEIIFSKKNEPCSVGDIGRYKDKPIPYGSAEIISEQIEVEENEISFLNKVLQCIRYLKSSNVEIILHYDIAYSNQCNIEFKSEILKKIADFNIPFTITCYEDNSLE